MSERSFEYGGATITVRASIGWDGLDKQFVINKLRPAVDLADELIWNRALNFVEAVVRTVKIEGDLGFAWVTPRSDERALVEAYEAWGTTDGGALALTWIGALTRASIDLPGDPDLYPAIDEKKGVTPPSGKNGSRSEPSLTNTLPEQASPQPNLSD